MPPFCAKFLIIVFCLIEGVCSATAQEPLKLSLSLSKNQVVFGEPVWVVLRVTNTSKQTLRVDVGPTCPVLPIKIEVPGAANGLRERTVCSYGYIGSCLGSAPPHVAPGETLTERYLLERALEEKDQHIGDAGEYQVLVDKEVRYDLADEPIADEYSPLAYALQTTKTLTLKVLLANPARLERAEQMLAASLQERRTDAKQMMWNWETAYALSTLPSPGLEPLFRKWIEEEDPGLWSDAIRGLGRMHTARAHADLVELTNSESKKVRQSALVALTDAADPADLGLFEKIAEGGDDDVRHLAIVALGIAGGAREIDLLTRLLGRARGNDRANVLRALGDSGAVEAIPILLAALHSNEDESWSAGYALQMLTHHFIPEEQNEERESRAAAWQSWWFQNQHAATVYSPYQCLSAAEWASR